MAEDIIQKERFAHDLLFNINKSIRYHSKRRRFYSFLHRIFQVIIVTSGTSAVSFMWSNNTEISIYFSALVAFIGVVDFIFDLSGSARVHDDIYRRLVILAGQFPINFNLSDKKANYLWEQRFLIGADEPPILRNLDVICHNEELLARGYDDDQFIDLYFYQRWFSYLFDLPPSVKATAP